jgi:hypothetical protein
VIQEAEVASGQQPVPVADGEAELLVQQRRDAPAKLMNSPAPGW